MATSIQTTIKTEVVNTNAVAEFENSLDWNMRSKLDRIARALADNEAIKNGLQPYADGSWYPTRSTPRGFKHRLAAIRLAQSIVFNDEEHSLYKKPSFPLAA